MLSKLLKKDVLINFSEINDETKGYDVIKTRVRVKRVPEEGETVYFNVEGPFYLVTAINNDLTVENKHEIWVNLSKINK